MNVVAVIAVRNGADYIGNALQYLMSNGVKFAIIDNESTDATADIVLQKKYEGNLVAFETLAFDGFFDLEMQLRSKMGLMKRLDADWVIHADVDEIMHSYRPDETLSEAIARIDAEGYNVIDFNEFVFLPVEDSYLSDFEVHQPIRHYYFFEPHSPRLMRAWKNSFGPSMVDGAGHVLNGEGIRLAPETFALRHYIFTDQRHAYSKYCERRFAATDLSRGWHGNRVNLESERFRFPDIRELNVLPDPSSRELDRSSPRQKHYWQWLD
jgi:hypothetical protein